MDDTHKRKLEDYLNRIEGIANEAEELSHTAADPYKSVLKAEVNTYRELIALWRKRITPKSD